MKGLLFTMTSTVLIYVNLISCATIPSGDVPVKPFNKEKYLGKWYEIARMDFRFERNLNNVTAEYSIKDKGIIKVDNRGFNFKSKEWKQAIGKAKLSGDPNEGRLKVSFFGPFYSAYNVIAIDDNYKYALVAGKNLKYLWILSRETTIPENIKQLYLQKAKESGFDVSVLVWTEHNSK